MKYFFYLIVALVQNVYSQQINFTTGIASYAMKSMKYHGENLQEDFPVDARFVAEFPVYIYYELSVTQRIRNCYVGGSISYGSTGARINYTDYSGSITADQNVRYFEFGPQFAVLLNPEATVSYFKFTLKPAVLFGRYDLVFATRIGDQFEKEDIGFNSINIALQPGLSYSHRILKKFDLTLHAGYNANLYKGDLIFRENDSLFLKDKKGDKVTLDWSGLRIGMGVNYNFSW